MNQELKTLFTKTGRGFFKFFIAAMLLSVVSVPATMIFKQLWRVIVWSWNII